MTSGGSTCSVSCKTPGKAQPIREKLQSVGEKLQYTAMVRSQLARGAGKKAEIAIIRKGEKGPERIIASEDTELQPGDTVEVTLRYQEVLTRLPKAKQFKCPIRDRPDRRDRGRCCASGAGDEGELLVAPHDSVPAEGGRQVKALCPLPGPLGPVVSRRILLPFGLPQTRYRAR